MKSRMHLKLSVLGAMIAAFGVSSVQAANIDKATYNTGKTRIEGEFKAGKTACAAMAGNAKDICMEEAKGKERVARAELEHSFTGKAADGTKVLVARAESTYAIAKERCDDLAGNAKDVCLREAKAAETRGLAEAKLGKQVGEARKNAAQDINDANYRVAIEKCDALSGDPKTSCVASAKVKFGKN